MKHLSMWFMVVVVLVFMFAGCAKEPAQEISDAKAAVDAAIKEGGDIYTPDQVKMLNDDLTSAVEEAKAQTGKLFKSNDAAKQKLAKIKADADALTVSIPAKKEEAKNNAVTGQNEAKTAIDEAKALVEKAPQGKGTKADIEAFNAGLTALDEALAEVQKTIDSQDYFGAVEKSKAIKEKAAAISAQINQAIEKIMAEKPQKRQKKK